MKASAKLCTVSASSATEPEAKATRACLPVREGPGETRAPGAAAAGRQLVVDRVGSVVAVGPDDRQEHTEHPTSVVVVVLLVLVRVLVLVLVPAVGRGAGRVGAGHLDSVDI